MTGGIIIKNARLHGSDGSLKDIVIKDGKITAISNGITESADEILDAQGNLVTESFVNEHLHLDKVYTLEKVGMDALSSYKSGTMGEP